MLHRSSLKIAFKAHSLPRAWRQAIAAVAIAACSSVAWGANILIVNTGAYAGTDSYLQAQLLANGHTVTVSGVPSSVAGYDQVWDLGYSVDISGAYAAVLTSFLQGGGSLFLVGENPGAAPIRIPAIGTFLGSLGAGTVAVGGYGTASPQTVSNMLLLANNSANITFAGSGKFGSVGSGVCGTSDCTVAVWPRGSLSAAPAGRLVSVLDTNFLTGGYANPPFIANLAAYLASTSSVPTAPKAIPSLTVGVQLLLAFSVLGVGLIRIRRSLRSSAT